MRGDVFIEQMQRLRNRFGEKNFDREFVDLVWKEVCGMTETGFIRLVDVLIGTRSANKPPLISDFREAKLREDKLKFENEVNGASRAVNHPANSQGLKLFLAGNYPGAKSVMEAVEQERLKLQIRKANDEPEPAA